MFFGAPADLSCCLTTIHRHDNHNIAAEEIDGFTRNKSIKTNRIIPPDLGRFWQRPAEALPVPP